MTAIRVGVSALSSSFHKNSFQFEDVVELFDVSGEPYAADGEAEEHIDEVEGHVTALAHEVVQAPAPFSFRGDRGAG